MYWSIDMLSIYVHEEYIQYVHINEEMSCLCYICQAIDISRICVNPVDHTKVVNNVFNRALTCSNVLGGSELVELMHISYN